MMDSPADILASVLADAEANSTVRSVTDGATLARIDFVARCLANRAGVRLLMSCALAKIHKPAVDPRCPYTEIGGSASFSGRTYDERYITAFINANSLPCNSTTAFLTPALRNIDRPLTTDVEIVGRPPQVYHDTLLVLDEIAKGQVSARDVLTDVVRLLLEVRDEKRKRMDSLLSGLVKNKDGLPLSSEAIVRLIQQHLACKHSSRLPVLVVAAAYKAASSKLGEHVLPLRSHNAADEQTGAIGDVEVCLENDDKVVSAYEMKMKRVTVEDIDRAVTKIVGAVRATKKARGLLHEPF